MINRLLRWLQHAPEPERPCPQCKRGMEWARHQTGASSSFCSQKCFVAALQAAGGNYERPDFTGRAGDIGAGETVSVEMREVTDA